MDRIFILKELRDNVEGNNAHDGSKVEWRKLGVSCEDDYDEFTAVFRVRKGELNE